VEDLLVAHGHQVQAVAANGHGLDGTADVVVHLSAGDRDALVERPVRALEGLEDLLTMAEGAGVAHVVLLSSAMVYGAWPNNPVPLTEDSPLRPDASFEFAERLAEMEAAVETWRRRAPGRRTTVLRPALVLGGRDSNAVVSALAAGMGHRFAEDDAPAQFLHPDDLARAVALAVTAGLDGVYNVAPDGWIPADRVRALAGDGPRLKLPSALADLVGHWRWRFQRGPLPPGLMPYVRYPWLVANDRLKQAGWSPTVTNEQAYVEGTEARWWTMLSPQRRQELALGAAALAAFGLGLGIIGWIRRVGARTAAPRR
jgi:nucleoside-diphosphate-sugar epimerase